IVIAGHKTSVSLEDAFWKGLKEIASGRDMTLSDLVAAIDSERQHGNLSSAIRLFVLDFYRNQLSDHNEGRDGTRGVLIARAASPALRLTACFIRAASVVRTIFPTGSAAAGARVPASAALGSARLAWRPPRAATAARAAWAPDGCRLAAAAVARVRPPAPRVWVLTHSSARLPPLD